MSALRIKIILFEDDVDYGRQLPLALEKELADNGEVRLFRPPDGDAGEGLYEDRLIMDLGRPDYENPNLIVADRDLSRTQRYAGMSESVVKRVADVLSIPECGYARGEHGENFMQEAEHRESRIALSLRDGTEKFSMQVVSVARGFSDINERLPNALISTGKKSPGRLLATLLGKPEYADKIALYASGDQNRLASALRVKSGGVDKVRRLTCLLGYWLWDSVLRYPGVVVNAGAASSYLNIYERDFREQSDIRGLFEDALYNGPFAAAKGAMWWRGMLDDIVAGHGGCEDGRDFVQTKLNRDIRRSECCEDATKRAGYYCMLSNRPVSLENSKGGLSWFPRGADLARVSTSRYDELAPWI